MEINTQTPTDSITIADQVVKVHTPYIKDHKCTENEASALNQLRKENIRNNQREVVKKMVEEKKGSEVPKAILEYSKTYVFGQSGGGGHISDPVEREAIDLCKERIKAALKAKGVDLKTVSAKDLTDKAKQVLAKNPKIMEQAKAIVKARGEIAIPGLDDLPKGKVE